MGTSSHMPYVYDHIAYPDPNFNPKAITEACYNRRFQHATKSSTTAKREGPLINFNAHPDSYVAINNGLPNTNLLEASHKDCKPLPAATKTAVVAVRWAQFVLRLLQEACALGLLTATICVRSTKGVETYLLRIPQAWDSLIGLYALYHLLRPAKGRTPSSSAAYHTFALVMDVALIPLYVYVTLLVNTNRHLPEPQYSANGDELDGNWRWTSFFHVSGTTSLLMVTYLAAAVIAVLHLLSCGLDLYLIVVFRQITNLPPDMDPLEDNLTSRARSPLGSRHKYKNSEVTLNSNRSISESYQKKLAHLSGSTLSVGDQSRLSAIGKDSFMGERQVPLGHSRTGSKTSLALSPHNPESAMWSRHQFDGQQAMYQEAVTNPRPSWYEVTPDGKLEPRSRRSSQAPSKRGSTIVTTPTATMAAGAERRPFVQVQALASVATASYHTSQQASASPGREGSPAAVFNFSRPGSPRGQAQAMSQEQEQKQQLLDDNWYVLDASDDNWSSPSPSRTPAAIVQGESVQESFGPSNTGPSNGVDIRDMVPHPLAPHHPMPPIPPELEHLQYSDPTDEPAHSGSGVNRSPTAASAATQSSSLYSESAPSLKSSKGHGPGTPKGRFYGNLSAATNGIRNGHTFPANNAVPGSGSAAHYDYGLPPSPQPNRTPSPEKTARVISRTGADFADESGLFEPERKYSMRNRRDVSGKVAEEGRGGPWRGRG